MGEVSTIGLDMRLYWPKPETLNAKWEQAAVTTNEMMSKNHL
jgi:hypothetical protein